jgi:hypothetical protein
MYGLKILGVIIASHVTHYGCEWVYYNYCARSFMLSIVTAGSPACKGLRVIADTSTMSMFDIIGTTLVSLSSIAKGIL